METLLYKGFKDRCILCKLGLHKKFTFRRNYIIYASDKYPLLTQHIRYFKKHGKYPQDEIKGRYACSCSCGCGKEKIKNLTLPTKLREYARQRKNICCV